MHLHLFISMSRRRQWHPTPVLLPGESHGRKSLVGCSTWGCEGRTRLSDFPFTFHFHALEKEMATHSSVLAWRIPGTGEPGGLLSLVSHRVGHDWSDLAAAAAFSIIQQMLAIWSLVPLPFLNLACTSGSSQFAYCWSLAWRILSIILLACEMSAIVG